MSVWCVEVVCVSLMLFGCVCVYVGRVCGVWLWVRVMRICGVYMLGVGGCG